MFSSTIPYQGVDMLNMDFAFAQLSGNNIIQLTSTSSYTDDFGNFHIIGEVNNTSPQPQTNIVVTAILSNTSTNVIIGNYSAFSSIETLRSGELSPFDIVIQNPQQVLGTFDFMEFFVTSQPASVDKPANLVLNGSSSFVDNVGNPHIIGNIINQGQSPEQLLNLAITFYDNSSLGVVGTQSFGLNVGSLVNNQMAPFDITITDNKTKSQAAFYSLNVDSAQSSMSPPLNPKFSFNNGGGITTEQFVTGGLFAPLPPLLPLTNDNQGSDNDDDNNNDNDDNGRDNNDKDSRSINGNDATKGSADLYNCEDFEEKDIFVGTNDPHNLDDDGDGIGCDSSATNNKNTSDLYNCEDFEEKDIFVGTNDPHNLDDDGDGIGCDSSRSSNDTNSSSDLNCADVSNSNISVGNTDPNDFDADGDGIGCETNSGNEGKTNNDNNEEQDEQQTEQTTDPRNDPKYDSIDWQADDPEENLTIEEMDEILEERENEDQEQSGDDGQQEQDTTSDDSNDDGDSDSDDQSEDNSEGQDDDDEGGGDGESDGDNGESSN
jgi:hypothetical protein